MEYAKLEFILQRGDAESYPIGLRFKPFGSATTTGLEPYELAPVKFDIERLNNLNIEPDEYSRCLSKSLFADPKLQTAFAQAHMNSQSYKVPLRMRLEIGSDISELHGLRWETLCDLDGNSLVMSEGVLFSRYLNSSDFQPIWLRPKGSLSALVVIANPTDLHAYQLPPIDVIGELTRAKTGLGAIPVTELTAPGSATLNNLIEHLRTAPDILYLVCHGKFRRGEPWLCLEKEDGKVDHVTGKKLAGQLKELLERPRLIVLASCQSAGTGEVWHSADTESALMALGPSLAKIGIPAIIAMQGNISMKTVEQFVPTFFQKLQLDGQIDQAMALARAAVRDRYDAWVPVLFLRLDDGRLWSEPEPTSPPPQPSHPREVVGFVGREDELETLAAKLKHNHLAIITGTLGIEAV